MIANFVFGNEPATFSVASAIRKPTANTTSNVVLGVFEDLAHHPLRRLHDAGVRITLGSDDPPYWGASIGGEYAVARSAFGFTDEELVGLTRTAIDAAFAEEPLKSALCGRIAL